MKFEIDDRVSSIYELVTDTLGLCEICQEASSNSKIISLACHHRVCLICFREYFNVCMEDFEIYPLKCPAFDCNEDVYKSVSEILDTEAFSRFKHLRYKKEKLRDPAVKWCTVINCDGYGREDQDHRAICNSCQTEISPTADPETERILQTCSVIQCPGCRCLVIKGFGCMHGKCYCGTELCMKCGRNFDKHHNSWVCLGSDSEGRVSMWAVVFSIFSYLLVPFAPLFVFFMYRSNWDRNYWPALNEHPWVYGFIIALLSPMLLVFGIFLLPFVWGWMCVECLFARKHSSWWILLKIVLYGPAVILTFLGTLLGLGLIISFLPLYGVALLVYELKYQKKSSS